MHYVYLSNKHYAIIAQGDKDMEPKPNKNEALEALDFIINVLKEHEKDLDRLIGQLGIITESLGETGEITEKIENIEDRISKLQSELTKMIKNISVPQPAASSPSQAAAIPPSPSHEVKTPLINIKCKKWEDFKVLAAGAETVSYSYKTSEDTFQATAIKDGKMVSCTGEFPANSTLLKIWLSNELNVNEKTVFEGALNSS
jgi:hypothetical protein